MGTIKILTNTGIYMVSTNEAAMALARNAANSETAAVVVSTTGETLIVRSANGRIFAYDVRAILGACNNELMCVYRRTCAAAYAAEERRAAKAATSRPATKATGGIVPGSPKDLDRIFDSIFGKIFPKKA